MDTIKNNTIRRRVSIDPNLKKIREMLDKDGNVINPVTKQVIKPNEDNKKNE